MAKASGDSDSLSLSIKDVQAWLGQEITDLTKAVELRLAEATAIVTDYASGVISSEQALARMSEYQHRWGEALPGTHFSRSVTDEQILAKVDETREPGFHKRLVYGRKRDAGSEAKRD